MIFFVTDFKDDNTSTQTTNAENGCALPWVVASEKPNPVLSDDDITSGEFVLRTLFAEFTILAERKIELVLAEPLVSPLKLNFSKPTRGFIYKAFRLNNRSKISSVLTSEFYQIAMYDRAWY